MQRIRIFSTKDVGKELALVIKKMKLRGENRVPQPCCVRRWVSRFTYGKSKRRNFTTGRFSGAE